MQATGTLSDLFKAQVRLRPEQVAVRCDGRSVSYGELDLWSDRLARVLHGRGVRAGDCILICLDRSIELMVTLVAAQKLGAAYLPLQNDLPLRRREYIVRDAAPAVIVVQPHLSNGFESFSDLLFVVHPAIYERTPDSPVQDSGAMHGRLPAYIMYTSGSTGEPKGVVNEQQALVNRLVWMRDHYNLDARDVVLQKTPYTFDVSVWEFYLPLISGAALVLARPDGHRDIDYLGDLIDREGVTVLHFVPSMLNAFVEEAGDSGFPSVRQVFCSGEELTAALVVKFRRKFHAGARLANLYGPTEAAIDVSCFDCPPNFAASQVPIGSAITNVQLHVLDSHLLPVPKGESGFLYIGGVALASGYVARPALTAAKFIPDPFDAKSGQRLYATGDVARELPDGNIVFLGRADDQVKINGQRIELGEIETHLQRHPDVAAAVVVPHSLDGESKQLVAYVVARGVGDGLCAESLRRDLSTELPPHMIPQLIVELPHIPLNSSGKVDRRKLPAPVVNILEDEGRHYTDSVEADVALLWNKYLRIGPGLDRGRTLFELGGDSILAMRLVAALKRKGYALSVRDLFEHRTLQQLVSLLRDRSRSPNGAGGRSRLCSRDEVLALRSSNQLDSLELDAADRHVLEERIGRPVHRLAAVCRTPSFVSGLLYDSMTMHSKECNLELILCDFRDIEIPALIDAWQRTIRRHEILRTQFCYGRAGNVFQLIYEDAELDYKVFDWRAKSSEECAMDFDRLLAHAWSKGVNLQSSGLMRLYFLRKPGGGVKMAWFQHHALTDGWSYHIILQDLCRYAMVADPFVGAPELFQYRDFCNLLRTVNFESTRRYWKEYLGDIGTQTSLVHALGRSAPGGRRTIVRKEQRVEGMALERLSEVAAALQATLNAVMQTTWGILLSQRTGIADITYASGVSLRQIDLPEIEWVTGPLLNILPVRL
ncbi:MAG TPA: amino acid adenylation domain-containing protein [Steroidobacteraceae bacterium]|nr:amino acid adenylation domain-containing protein [Steroidobacteraceae bacterium]